MDIIHLEAGESKIFGMKLHENKKDYVSCSPGDPECVKWKVHGVGSYNWMNIECDSYYKAESIRTALKYAFNAGINEGKAQVRRVLNIK